MFFKGKKMVSYRLLTSYSTETHKTVSIYSMSDDIVSAQKQKKTATSIQRSAKKLIFFATGRSALNEVNVLDSKST